MWQKKFIQDPSTFSRNLFDTFRHLLAAIILFAVGFTCQIVQYFTLYLVKLLTFGNESLVDQQFDFMKEKSIGRFDAFQKLAIDPSGDVKKIALDKTVKRNEEGIFTLNYTDDAAMCSVSRGAFNIDDFCELMNPDNMIRKAKEFTRANLGLDDVDKYLADDFHFIFPIVFLDKKRFKESLTSVPKDFHDIEVYYYGWQVDCFEPNRVWAMSRGWVTIKGKRVPLAIQKLSMSFCPKTGKCYKLTGGYVIDRESYFSQNEGLGGLFAINRSAGIYIPIPELNPWKPSLEWHAFANHIGEIINIWRDWSIIVEEKKKRCPSISSPMLESKVAKPKRLPEARASE